MSLHGPDLVAQMGSEPEAGKSHLLSCTIDDLPDELLALIFHQLEWQERLKVEFVCQHWSRVARQQGWSDMKEFTVDWDMHKAVGKRRTPLLMFRAIPSPTLFRSFPHWSGVAI